MLLHYFQDPFPPTHLPKNQTTKKKKQEQQSNLNSKTAEDILIPQWEIKYRTHIVFNYQFIILWKAINNFIRTCATIKPNTCCWIS